MAFSMFSAQTSPIAVDFGSSSVKLMQIGSGDRPSIVAAAELPVPDADRTSPQALVNFCARELPRALKEGKFRGRRVICVIPSGQTHVQHMQLAPVEGVSVDNLLKGQLQMQMGCSPKSIVVRSVEVADVHRDGMPKKEIICFAVSKETVMGYVDMLKRCKLEPVGVHTETVAMVRAFDHLNRRAEDANLTTLYVDFGWSGTRVAISHGRHLRFARYISLGGRNFDQLIAKQNDCDLPAARAHRIGTESPWRLDPRSQGNIDDALPEGMAVVKAAMARANAAGDKRRDAPTLVERRVGATPSELRYQGRPEDEALVNAIGADVGELLEMMTDELMMGLRYHRALFPGRAINRVIFVGGESRQAWFCQHFIRGLRLSAQLGDPITRLAREDSLITPGLNLNEPQPGWAVACGLSIAPTDL